MKYKILNEVIPQSSRKELNEKILHIIQNGIEHEKITPEIIFNAYTGDGGLTGLDFKNFENLHSFSEAKKEIEQGQFFTPHNLAKFLVECIKPKETDSIADLTCGMGNFFNYCPVESNCYGTELDVKAYTVASYLYPKANIMNDDIRFYDDDIKFDIVFGNPPFNLKWKIMKEEIWSQDFYCNKAYKMLKPSGFLALIMPESYLKDDFFNGSAIENINEKFSFICQFDLPTKSFKDFGVESFKTKVMLFQKKSKFMPIRKYALSKIDPPEITEQGAESIYSQYIAPLVALKAKYKAQIFFENIQENIGKNGILVSKELEFRLKKIMFDIRRNPKLKRNESKAESLIARYYSQEKPDNMSWEDWEKNRYTEKMLLRNLKSILKKEHEVEKDEIRLVKTNYGFKLKGYSTKRRAWLSKWQGIKKGITSDMVMSEIYPFDDNKYQKLINKKIKAYKLQNTQMKRLKPEPLIEEYLNKFTLYDKAEKITIHLNDMQKEDLGKVLQKRYSILNWQQGSGKTIAGVVWGQNLLKECEGITKRKGKNQGKPYKINRKVKNVFVVSSALSINLTWSVKLQDYGIDFINIRKSQDIKEIREGQFILITFDMLIKYRKLIYKFVKMNCHKLGLIVDESDELTNYNSQRTKATKYCFRKLPYKILTTGTTTRNNINELYSQLELLYNNSVNMICECETIWKFNKERELVPIKNKYYMSPYPAWWGNGLFKSCFSPRKTTVFGIKKDTQNIFNMEQLKHIIEKTIITRKFQEITGKKIYSIHTHKVNQSDAERAVYKIIMQEFYKMLYYFRSTGNDRKDSMLKIIRQIQLLIKATSIPDTFKEYREAGCYQLPTKFFKVFDLLKEFSDEKVAIGTVFIESAEKYYYKIRNRFPSRKVFLIKGDVSFNKRKDIIRQFEQTSNGILISTQQSLKQSVNIPTCNKVIIESMQWNIPRIEQYYFRFIRFNSKENKEVHFIAYDNTIEQNLLGLLMAKERINEFIKTLEFKEQSEIFAEYDIDTDILDNIIEKAEDEEGNIVLTWGNQSVS